jgi:hypothetical protein
MTIYERHGYRNRQEYIDSLVYEYGPAARIAADMLGPNEDFDGLLVELENFEDMERR